MIMAVLGLGSNKFYSGRRVRSGARPHERIDATKFGYDLSVRPTDRPAV